MCVCVFAHCVFECCECVCLCVGAMHVSIVRVFACVLTGYASRLGVVTHPNVGRTQLLGVH